MYVDRLGRAVIRKGIRSIILTETRHGSNGLCISVEFKGGGYGFLEQEMV